MTVPSRDATVCELNATGRHDIRLAVWQSRGNWRWAMISRGGDVVLSRGVSESELAARVACQFAHETWLCKEMKRHGGTRWDGQYVWDVNGQLRTRHRLQSRAK